jgi:hypothetical protein
MWHQARCWRESWQRYISYQLREDEHSMTEELFTAQQARAVEVKRGTEEEYR